MNSRKYWDRWYYPKKGRRNKKEEERETSVEFRARKKKHSTVESGINALKGFKRYVALAVVARNIQKMGSEITREKRDNEEQEKERERRRA